MTKKKKNCDDLDNAKYDKDGFGDVLYRQASRDAT